MVSHWQGLPTLAMVGVVGLWSVAGVILAREGVAHEEAETVVKLGLGRLVSPWINGGSLPSGGEVSARYVGWRLGDSCHLFCHGAMASLRIVEHRCALVGGVGRVAGVGWACAAAMVLRRRRGWRGSS